MMLPAFAVGFPILRRRKATGDQLPPADVAYLIAVLRARAEFYAERYEECFTGTGLNRRLREPGGIIHSWEPVARAFKETADQANVMAGRLMGIRERGSTLVEIIDND